MRKEGLKFLSFFVILLMLIGGVFAQLETDANGDGEDLVDKAYDCLNDRIDESTLSLQDAVFSVLAVGADQKLLDKIDSEKSPNEDCWPKGGCKIRDSALVMLAYDRIGKNSDGVESWLKSKSVGVEDLDWFLQIDIETGVAASCTINYDGQDRSISILEDQTISGSAGACFSIANEGYWLQIRSNCLDKEFTISCDQDFITAILYQRRDGPIFVSSDSQGAASLGTTQEKVEAKCFRTGANCDYEGSLWATLALQKSGEDVTEYAPYLLALADDNGRFFPDAFLYAMFGGDGHYSNIVEAQKQGNYWQKIGSPYNRFYDTSLAMLSLQGSNAAELDNAKSYLLSIQTSDGCWNNNNIRDTAFVLYGGWTESVPLAAGASSPESCVSAGFYCEKTSDCTDEGGDILNEFDCTSEGFGYFCCSVDVPEESCSEKGGVICASGESCSDAVVSSSDGGCCLGTCEPIEEQNTCELFDGRCRFSCEEGEVEDEDLDCGDEVDKICCIESLEEEGISLFWWIILLLILIVIVGIAIWKRNQIRLWLYKRRVGVTAAPVVRPRGPPPTAYPSYRPTAVQRPVRRAVSPQERALSETLSKLRGTK